MVWWPQVYNMKLRDKDCLHRSFSQKIFFTFVRFCVSATGAFCTYRLYLAAITVKTSINDVAISLNHYTDPITMKTVWLLLALLMPGAYALYAQTDYALTATDSVTGFCAFNQVEVLDARTDKEDMGYFKTGAFNAKTRLVPKQGVEVMLRRFVESITATAAEKQPATLLLVLRDYKITDRPIAGEMGTFYARINCYRKTANGYTPLFSADSFYETANGWDVTKSIKRLADRKMTAWIKAAAETRTTTDIQPTLTLEQIAIAGKEGYQKYKVYTEAPHKGIYYTYEQFLANTPADTAFVERHYRSDGYDTYTFYTRRDNGKKGDNLDKKECFALYNGEKWFKKTSIGLYEMKFKDGDFYFPETGSGIRGNDDMVVLFGLAGALFSNPSAKTKGAVYRMRYNPDTNSGQSVERLQ